MQLKVHVYGVHIVKNGVYKVEDCLGTTQAVIEGMDLSGWVPDYQIASTGIAKYLVENRYMYACSFI